VCTSSILVGGMSRQTVSEAAFGIFEHRRFGTQRASVYKTSTRTGQRLEN
jgi:hypothetical protein